MRKGCVLGDVTDVAIASALADHYESQRIPLGHELGVVFGFLASDFKAVLSLWFAGFLERIWRKRLAWPGARIGLQNLVYNVRRLVTLERMARV